MGKRVLADAEQLGEGTDCSAQWHESSHHGSDTRKSDVSLEDIPIR